MKKGNQKLFEFIIYELFPFMTGHKEAISADMTEEEEDEIKEELEKRKELEDAILKAKNKLYDEQEIYAREKFGGDPGNEHDFFIGLVGNKDIITLKDVVYALDQVEEPKSDITLKIGSQIGQFKIYPIKKVSEIEEKYFDYLQWTYKNEAISEMDENLDQTSSEQIQKIVNFDFIARKDHYSSGEIGFLKHEGNVFVYNSIPAFAMLDPRPGKEDICYEFPPMRVGIEIWYNDDRIKLGQVRLIDPVWHPFTKYDDTPFQVICGSNIPSSKDLTNVEWVAKTLDDAKNLAMNGLTPTSLRKHRAHGYYGGDFDDIMAHKLITVKEARRRGLVFTNNWDWKEED